MKKEIRDKFIEIRDMLELENQRLGEDFPITSTKNLGEFYRNQNIISIIHKILKWEK